LCNKEGLKAPWEGTTREIIKERQRHLDKFMDTFAKEYQDIIRSRDRENYEREEVRSENANDNKKAY
jgi:hypothetical protein